jgi:tRNA pseudouridine55 synthase
MIFNIYKQRGETPLECLNKFRDAHSEFKEDKWTYMGRLDPMAEGLLLVASGDEVKTKEEFTNLDKEYEFTAFFGFSTDTYDILGKITKIGIENLADGKINEGLLTKLVEVYKGEREQKYPPFSSKTINGIAMHELARSGELENHETLGNISNNIPIKKINIYDLKIEGFEEINSKELLGKILLDISKVKGDFRQAEIINLWKEALEKVVKNSGSEADGKISHNIICVRFRAKVSSGTYIRSIVNDLGNSLGVGACTLSIKRTKVGDYKVEDSII